jgi:ankyrin repeat protein
MSVTEQWQLEDAVDAGHIATAEVLLHRGIDPDTLCHGIETPVVNLAVDAANTPMVVLFARFGADIEQTDRTGRTLLSRTASRSERNQSLVTLLAAGADPNLQDRTGWAPLHWAAVHGYRENIAVLIAHGADTNTKAANGMTPAMLAQQNQHWEAAEQLRTEPDQ